MLPLDLFAARRLTGAVVGLIGLAIAWRLGRRLGGPYAGLAGMVLLALCPLYYGHMFMNAKDVPFAVATLGLLATLVRAFDEFPRPGWKTVALFGLMLGLTLGTRIMGGLAVISVLAAALTLLTLQARRTGFMTAAKEVGQFAGHPVHRPGARLHRDGHRVAVGDRRAAQPDPRRAVLHQLLGGALARAL